MMKRRSKRATKARVGFMTQNEGTSAVRQKHSTTAVHVLLLLLSFHALMIEDRRLVSETKDAEGVRSARMIVSETRHSADLRQLILSRVARCAHH